MNIQENLNLSNELLRKFTAEKESITVWREQIADQIDALGDEANTQVGANYKLCKNNLKSAIVALISASECLASNERLLGKR